MLVGMFGWQVAALYVVSRLVIAVIAGIVIGRLKLERHVENFVRQVKAGKGDERIAGCCGIALPEELLRTEAPVQPDGASGNKITLNRSSEDNQEYHEL
jgi:uncharacterized membrane protein YraQ (UPF0718 family)